MNAAIRLAVLSIGLVRCGWTAIADGDVSVERNRLVAGYEQVVAPFLRTYCIECHGTKKAEEGLDYERLRDGRAAIHRRDLWRFTAEKIAHFEMPPERRPQPGDAERQQVLDWAAALRRDVPADPVGNGLRRLSTNEYRATIKDLFGFLPAAALELPEESTGPGFTSAISPLLMEQYLRVADEALDRAIKPGRYEVSWPAATLPMTPPMPAGAQGDPLGARTFIGAGELTLTIQAPIDGTYTLVVTASEQTPSPVAPATLRVGIGEQGLGEIAVKSATSRAYRLPLKLVPGRLKITIQLINPVFSRTLPPARPGSGRPSAPAEGAPKEGELVTRTITIDSVALSGPPAAAPTLWQREWFGRLPDKQFSRRDAATAVAARFAERAFRRPPTPEEIVALVGVFDLADAAGVPYPQAVAMMLKAALVSPQFLLLGCEGGNAQMEGIAPLGDWQLASRLSYLLWSAPPDAALLARAADGSLRRPAVLVAEANRLLDDPRSRALFTSFGAQWLGVDRLQAANFDPDSHPLIDDILRQAMYEEVALFFDGVLRERRSLLDFTEADYTWLNGPLAALYGVPWSAQGDTWKRVILADPRRRGVVTMPAILAVTSPPNRTSPVKRGVWVLQNLLGQSPPPPPMNVPPLEDQDTPANAALSLRQRAERHRSDPACANCHRLLDPIGFGLEHFDQLGRWRERDNTGALVDAAGELPGGQHFTSTTELLAQIASRREQLCRALAERFLAFALCRPLQDCDLVVVDRIVAATAQDGYRLRTLIGETVTSYPFLHRRLTP